MTRLIFIVLLVMASALDAKAERISIPGLGVTFDRSTGDPPIKPEVETGDLASLGSFVAHDALFSVLRANVLDPQARPVTESERQRSLLDAARKGGVQVTESGVTMFSGESAFFTVGTSTSGGRLSYQYSVTLMKEKRTVRFTLTSLAEDPRRNAPALRLLNSAAIQ